MNGNAKKWGGIGGAAALVVVGFQAWGYVNGFIEQRAEKLNELKDTREMVEVLEELDLVNWKADVEMYMCDLRHEHDPRIKWWRGECIRGDAP